MRRMALALALLATPAGATDILANAPDVETFAKVAAAAGYMTEDGTITVNGPLGSAISGVIGSWFYNYVGTAYFDAPPCVKPDGSCDAPVARSGVWARLRVNGQPTSALTNLIAVGLANGIVVYQQISQGDGACWSQDGAKCAVDQSIGQIGLIM